MYNRKKMFPTTQAPPTPTPLSCMCKHGLDLKMQNLCNHGVKICNIFIVAQRIKFTIIKH